MAEKISKIREQYKPDDNIRDDIRFVYERKQKMDTARLPHEKDWEQADKQYEMYRETRGADDWQSNFVPSTTTAIVESQLSEIIDQNFRPRYLARGTEDKPKAVIMNATSDYAWEVGRTDLELYKGIKDALIRGTGILQDYYRVDKRKVQMPDGQDKDGKEQFKDQEMTDYDDLFAEVVKLEDFGVDPTARGFTGSYPARDCYRRFVMNIDTFKRMFSGPVWDPLDAAKFVKPGGDTNYYEFYKPPQDVDKKDEVEVIFYWGMMPTPGRPDYYDHLFVVANDVMIKHGPNPYNHKKLPFVRILDIMNPHSFYGKGEAKLLETIQEEIQTYRRQSIDRNHLDIDKSFLVSNREAGLDEDETLTQPHNIIHVDDPANVKPLEYNDVGQSFWVGLKKLEEDATRVTGYDDRMQSVQQQGSTATEAAILKEATLKRLRSKIWLLRNETIWQMGCIREANIRQFYPIPKIEQIVGDKSSEKYFAEIRQLFNQGRMQLINGKPHKKVYRQIRMNNKALMPTDGGLEMRDSKEPTYFEATPELLTPKYGQFDVKIEPSPTIPVSKAVETEQANLLFDRIMQIAIQAPDKYDIVKLADLLISTHDYDPDELKPDKGMQGQLDQGLMKKQMMMAEAENKEMLSGKPIPPTSMATEPHTEIHIALINAPEMQNEPADSPIMLNLTRHIMGEMQAQQARGQAQQQQKGQMAYSPPSGPSPLKMSNVLPGGAPTNGGVPQQ